MRLKTIRYNTANWSWTAWIWAILWLVTGCEPSTPSHSRQSRVAALPYYQDAAFTPVWLQEGSDTLVGFHRIPPFSLVNQSGETVTERTFAGKIYVADFFFTTCPGICPKMTKNMGVLQEAFQEDDNVLLLSHTVMPRQDSVPALREYADERGVRDGKWHLVTGDRGEIYRLGRLSYFVEENLGIEKPESGFLHTENFVLIDRNRHIRGIYNGLNANDIDQLIADIRTLQKE